MSSKEITYVAKTFVIDNPTDQNKYLVHACLEGPEAGVYYRGKGEIINNHSTEIYLPHYVDNLATEFTVQITPIYNGNINIVNCSEVKNNKFTVYSNDNMCFYWLVHGSRYSIEVEPLKENINIAGDGPYTYLVKR